MSLSDCFKCYDTPCRCGHAYTDWRRSERIELIRAVLTGFPLESKRSLLAAVDIELMAAEGQKKEEPVIEQYGPDYPRA